MKVDVFVGVWFGRGVLAFGVMCHVAVTGSGEYITPPIASHLATLPVRLYHSTRLISFGLGVPVHARSDYTNLYSSH